MHSWILRNNNNNVYLNVTEWLASPCGATFSKPIEEMSKQELNACLKCFYTSARKKDGTYYKSSSTKSIRAAIDRFLRFPPNNKPFSIITDPAFTEANKVLDAFVKDLRKKDKIAGVIHKKSNLERAGKETISHRRTRTSKQLGSCTVTEDCLVLLS